MKSNRKIINFIAIVLMLNTLVLFSGFCVGLFSGQMQSIKALTKSTQVTMANCLEQNPDLPTMSSGSGQNHAILPCCVTQNDQNTSAVTIEKTQPTKQPHVTMAVVL